MVDETKSEEAAVDAEITGLTPPAGEPAVEAPARRSKAGLWSRLVKKRWFLLAGLVKVALTGLCLVVCYQVLNSTPHKDIYIQWSTTPLTVGVSAALVLTVALREVLGQVKGKLAWQVRSWLTFLIPLLLLIFISIMLNKFNLVTSVG